MDLQLYQILLKEKRFDSFEEDGHLTRDTFCTRQEVDPIRFVKQKSASGMMFNTTELFSGSSLLSKVRHVHWMIWTDGRWLLKIYGSESLSCLNQYGGL